MKYSENDTSKHSKVSGGNLAIEKFTEMMINRLNDIKDSKWKKGWINGKGHLIGLPQNLNGRPYSGTNSFFLLIDTALKGYNMPVYLTFMQAQKEGLRINKGATAMPVIYWDKVVKDAHGKRISYDDYLKLSKDVQKDYTVFPFVRAFNIFNVDQTNLKSVNVEKYNALLERFREPELRDKEGMYACPSLDRMFEKQEWLCKVLCNEIVSEAFYSPSRDIVVIPKKEQFNVSKSQEEIYKDGMEYYSTAIHEMAHSTGAPNRLNREKSGRYGDDKYAKEELVAELTAALVGNTLGFDRRIADNNTRYVNGWLKVLQEEPKFIVSVMSDVGKASTMILGKIDEQKIALGERSILTPIESKENSASEMLSSNQTTVQEHAKDPVSSSKSLVNTLPEGLAASIRKNNNGEYVLQASVNGKTLGTKPINREKGYAFMRIEDYAEKRAILSSIVKEEFGDKLNVRPKQDIHRNQTIKL